MDGYRRAGTRPARPDGSSWLRIAAKGRDKPAIRSRGFFDRWTGSLLVDFGLREWRREQGGRGGCLCSRLSRRQKLVYQLPDDFWQFPRSWRLHLSDISAMIQFRAFHSSFMRSEHWILWWNCPHWVLSADSTVQQLLSDFTLNATGHLPTSRYV